MKQMHHLEKTNAPSRKNECRARLGISLTYNLQENAACQENQKGPSKQHIFYVTP